MEHLREKTRADHGTIDRVSSNVRSLPSSSSLQSSADSVGSDSDVLLGFAHFRESTLKKRCSGSIRSGCNFWQKLFVFWVGSFLKNCETEEET